MIKIQYLICLQITRVFAEPLTETSAECLETTTRNNSIGPNGTFVDLSDMETEEMNTREQAAYAERKYLETLRAGELGTWEEDEGAEGSGRQQDDEGEVSEGSGSSKSSTSLDVFWKAERKLMDLVPIDGPARNDSRGVELPPPPSHVRVRRKKKVPSIVNTEAAILEDVFDEAAEDYYDEPQFKPITKKDNIPGRRPAGSLHGNQTFFRGRYRSRKGLTYWLNQPARMFELEGVSIKPSPKHWPDPTHRSQNWTGAGQGSFVRRPGVQYTRTRPRGGRLRFSRKRNNNN